MIYFRPNVQFSKNSASLRVSLASNLLGDRVILLTFSSVIGPMSITYNFKSYFL